MNACTTNVFIVICIVNALTSVKCSQTPKYDSLKHLRIPEQLASQNQTVTKIVNKALRNMF